MFGDPLPSMTWPHQNHGANRHRAVGVLSDVAPSLGQQFAKEAELLLKGRDLLHVKARSGCELGVQRRRPWPVRTLRSRHGHLDVNPTALIHVLLKCQTL